MKRFKSLVLIYSFFLPLLITSCGDNKTPENTLSDLDRQELLENTGRNIILPSYKNLYSKAVSLDSIANKFASTPTNTELDALQDAFEAAYLAWQKSSSYQFGPAKEQTLLRENINTFPTNVSQINNNIASGSYNLNLASNLVAKGLPALDYLLFGLGADDAAILERYTTEEKAANRKAYLTALTADIKEKAAIVYNGWLPDQGNYLATFIGSTGTDNGSSLSFLVNEFNYDYEILKNHRIGGPLGKRTLGQPYPESVEAYYSGISAKLAKAHLEAIENLYLGRSEQADGPGLDDYLIKLNAMHGDKKLSDAIKQQLAIVKQALAAVPDPLSNTIISNPAIVDKAYTEIQKQLPLFKTDMPSAMAILIVYQDNDGD